jgi:hypothetical protein
LGYRGQAEVGEQEDSKKKIFFGFASGCEWYLSGHTRTRAWFWACCGVMEIPNTGHCVRQMGLGS